VLLSKLEQKPEPKTKLELLVFGMYYLTTATVDIAYELTIRSVTVYAMVMASLSLGLGTIDVEQWM
jgi:hypothetical protein